MLPVVDIDDQAHTDYLNDMLQNTLHSSADCDTGHGSNLDLDSSSNVCSSVASRSQEADDASQSQLLDSECMSTCRPQESSVIRLRKQMEMLARDEDIPVHCNIATEEEDAACCQFDVNKGNCEDNLMKSTRHSSDSVAVLSSCYVNDVDDGLFIADIRHASRPKNQQQLDGNMPDVPLSSEVVTSGHYVAFSSAKGNVDEDSCFLVICPKANIAITLWARRTAFTRSEIESKPIGMKFGTL